MTPYGRRRGRARGEQHSRGDRRGRGCNHHGLAGGRQPAQKVEPLRASRVVERPRLVGEDDRGSNRRARAIAPAVARSAKISMERRICGTPPIQRSARPLRLPWDVECRRHGDLASGDNPRGGGNHGRRTIRSSRQGVAPALAQRIVRALAATCRCRGRRRPALERVDLRGRRSRSTVRPPRGGAKCAM